MNRLYQNYLTKQIEHIYKHDSLTGLYNRLGFMNECENMLSRVRENDRMLTVVMADLDGLKIINDEYGHAAGDEAIRTVAVALKNVCPKDALCVRFGGDEMLAIMEGTYEDKDIRGKINDFLEDYNHASVMPYQVATSLGVLQVKGNDIVHLEDIFKKVDELMYIDKVKNKRNRIG